MASTNDETFGKYKLYSGIAIGGVLLAMVLDSCSGGPDEDVIAEANQPAAATETAAVDINTVEKNLEPVEKLAVVDKSAPPAPARTGEAVYQSACMACHAAGVLNAPKLEAGAWDERVGKGLDGLLQSSINGLNSMPPRGGNPDVTDEELNNAITYMLETSGYDVAALGGGAAPAEQQTAESTVTEQQAASAAETKAAAPAAPEQVAEAQPAPEKPAAPVAPQAPVPATQQATQVGGSKYITDTNVGKQVYQNVCFTCHDVGIAQAPVLGDTAVWQQLAAAGTDALYNNTAGGKGHASLKAGTEPLSGEQIAAAVDFMLTTAGVTAAAAPAAQEKQATEVVRETAPITETPATEQAAETAPAAVQSAIDGEKIYRGLCFSCHDAGIAEAPKLGDKAAWKSRIATGMEAIYTNSINGKGIMPAKGGNPALTDDEVKAAVDWMVQQSR